MKNGLDSIILYYGAGTNNLFWDGNISGKQNEDLSLLREVNITRDINITADKTITIECRSIQSTGNQTYDVAVVINAHTDLSSTCTNKLIYSKSKVTGDELHSLTVSDANSICEAPITKLTALKTDETATFNANASISAVWTLATQTVQIS